MTKVEIKEKRTLLVRTILEIEQLKTRKAALTKTLAPDFEENEAEYRSGVKTDAGLLFHIIDIDVGIGGEGIAKPSGVRRQTLTPRTNPKTKTTNKKGTMKNGNKR